MPNPQKAWGKGLKVEGGGGVEWGGVAVEYIVYCHSPAVLFPENAEAV